MDCKKIRELILTDYIDGEADPQIKKEIEEHLSTCSQCRIFEKAAREFTVEPFEKAQRERPPEYLWGKIRASIEEKRPKKILADAVDNLSLLLRRPQPLFVAATIMVLVLMATVATKSFFNAENAVNSYLDSQMEFLSYLDGYTENGYLGIDGEDLGTDIEEYFL